MTEWTVTFTKYGAVRITRAGPVHGTKIDATAEEARTLKRFVAHYARLHRVVEAVPEFEIASTADIAKRLRCTHHAAEQLTYLAVRSGFLERATLRSWFRRPGP
jgi:hypothetical protein